MRYKVPEVLVCFTFFCVALPSRAQHGGSGGHGAGGFSGHSIGHFGGHSSSGHAKGSASGRSRSGGPPLAGTTLSHGRIVPSNTPGFVPRPSRVHRPLTVVGFNPRHGFFGFALNSGFGFCGGLAGFPTQSFFGTDFDCLEQGFFFDPFFAAEPIPVGNGNEDAGAAPAESSLVADADVHQNVFVEDEPAAPVDKVPHHRRSPREPDTLLQLKDGSMYGLRDYWVVDGNLQYVTSYGGQNSISLARIDFDKTNQLNADRGVKFDVAPDSASESSK